MNQARKPKGSPNGTGGQFDTSGHANGSGTPPILDPPLPQSQWPADGIGTIQNMDLSGRDAVEILNMDWRGITMADSDLRDTHVTPLDLPYDPDSHDWSGPTFVKTLFGDRQGYASEYTRLADGGAYARVTIPGQPPRSVGYVDWQLQVADTADMPGGYGDDGDTTRGVTNTDEMRVEVNEWSRRQSPPVDADKTEQLAATLAKFVDEDHGVWRGTDIPANMDTVDPEWLDNYAYVHSLNDGIEEDEDW